MLPSFKLNDNATLLHDAKAVPFSEKHVESCAVPEDCSITSTASLDFFLEAEAMLSPIVIVEPISAAAMNIDKNANLVWFLFMLKVNVKYTTLNLSMLILNLSIEKKYLNFITKKDHDT